MWDTTTTTNNNDRSSVKCLSFKLSRVRFMTEPEIQHRELIITGSWMEQVNRICLWQYDIGPFIDSGQIQTESEDEAGITAGVLGDSADDPRLLSSLIHPGSVQDMKVHYPTKRVFTTSSNGSLHIFQLSNSDTRDAVFRLCRLIPSKNDCFPFLACQPISMNGNLPIALSSLSINSTGDHIYVANDLGQLAAIQLDRIATTNSNRMNQMNGNVGMFGFTRLVRFGLACFSSIDWNGDINVHRLDIVVDDYIIVSGADIASVNALEYIDNHSLVSVNQLGQLKLWDLRIGLSKPQRRLLRPGQTLPLLCIGHHPGQPHLLAVGGMGSAKDDDDDDGAAAYIWDLRAEQYPLTQVACEGQTIWETAFHPRQPKHLYMATETAGLLQISGRDETDLWTGFKGSRRKLTVSSVLPQSINAPNVTSFDLTHTRLACGHSDTVLHTQSCDKHIY